MNRQQRSNVLWSGCVLLALSGCNPQGKSSVTPATGPPSTTLFDLNGFVFRDLDGDGVQNFGEPGIEGIQVALTDGAELVEVTTTACDGCFSFLQLTEGTYVVAADAPVGLVPSGCSGCDTVTISVASDVTLDFGFAALFAGTIGDFVWHDLDADGVFDDGEPGLDGVDVVLGDQDGVELARTKTGRNGFYRFSDLLPATYRVAIDSETLPPDFEPTLSNFHEAAFDSDDSPVTVVLGTDRVDPTIDFGFLSEFGGSIGDFVWHDLDGDGVQDAGEPGLEGVGLVLRDDLDQVVFRTTTRQGGAYTFTGLRPGVYTVDIDLSSLPPGFSPSVCSTGQGGNDSNCIPASVALEAGGVATVDFGFQSEFQGVIGDDVWFDFNEDGLQDVDEGLEGVTVRLRNANCLVREMTTGDNGSYRFTGLPAGRYTITVDGASLPPGFFPTQCDQGEDDSIDSDCAPVTVNLAPDASVLSIDFGFVATFSGSIGDFVFIDANGDGLQNDEIGGMGGLERVRVVARVMSSGLIAAQDSTRETLTMLGRFGLKGLNPDRTYRVSYLPGSIPAGFSPTEPDVGRDDALDSDFNGSPVVLTPGNDAFVDLDFGFVPTCEVFRLDFETDDNGIPLVNGQDISTPPEFGILVAISSSGPNEGAAIFDSTPGGPNVDDDDLLVGLGNILILQEDPTQTVPGIFDVPDDANTGGELVFDFTAPSEMRSIDLIDVERARSMLVTLFDGDELTRVYDVPGGWTSDGTFGTLDLTSLVPQPGAFGSATVTQDAGFDAAHVIRLVVQLAASGAVDNLELCR